MHKPTDEQTEIISLAKGSAESILVNALAGAAKTTTIEMICHALPVQPILCLAFNKRIQEEMEKRLPGHVKTQTLNSVGHRVWATTCSSRIAIKSSKSYDLIKAKIDSLKRTDKSDAWDRYAEISSAVRAAKQLGYIPEGKFPNGKRLVSFDDFWALQDEEPDDFLISLVDEILTESISQGYKGLLDYDDQIYLPTLFGGSFPRFPFIMVDEAQDLSAINHAMLNKLVTQRIVAVGDPFQCQPPGTLVQTSSGEVPIEELKEGGQVISLHKDKSYLRPRTILETASRQYIGDLYRIETENNYYEATPNHRCLVRLREDRQNWHAVYLMKRGSNWRIGKTVLRRVKEKEFGIGLRARQEQADSIWLLEAFPTKEDALANEQLLAAVYGLPTFCFKNSGELAISQARLDWMWAQIGDNTVEATKLLTVYGRSTEHPIWSAGNRDQIAFTRQSMVRACNLDSELFEVPVINEQTVTWSAITITRRHYNGPVFSLKVEAPESTNFNGLYIANGIVTGNSIYGFRGAVANGMANLATRFSMVKRGLSISFRCPIEVVKLARSRAPHMQWAEGAKPGAIHAPDQWSSSSIPDGSAIICRNNAPLFACALRLLRAGRGVQLVGSDLGPGLVKTLKKLGQESLDRADTLKAIDAWEAERLKKTRAKAATKDKAECLRVFASFGSSLGAAIAYAENLFATRGPIQLLSGHKAKGLEWDSVYHLDPHRIPSPYAISDEELEQEKNVEYVITTRSKDQLSFVTLDTLDSHAQ